MGDNFFQNKESQNYLNVQRGLSFAGKALKPYTQAGLQNIHQQIYGRLAGYLPCTSRCSQTYQANFSSWCITCSSWLNELKKTKPTHHRISWEKLESWKWQDSYENIARVYLPLSWCKGDLRIDDLPTACHIWTNCKTFQLPNNLLDKVRNHRNNEAGHNPDLKVTDAKKAEIFNNLTQLFQENDVKGHIHSNCIDDLTRIQNEDDLQKEFKTIHNRFDSQEENIKQFIADALRQKKSVLCPRNVYLGLAFAFCFITILFVIYQQSSTPSTTLKHQRNKHKEECTSEDFSYPFKQDMRLLPYILDNSTLISRDWLYEDIEKELLNHKQKRGMYLEADMGYGKTSIVRGILCATNKKQVVYRIRQQLLAFHLCRFDVPSTRDPVRFIKRLIGFFSTTLAEYGGITTMSEHTMSFDSENCKLDVVACFDQNIMFPLKQLNSVPQNFLVVIDALDECTEETTKRNYIADLLQSRIKDLPPWIRYLITSRPLLGVIKTKWLKHLYLSTEDSRNKNDVYKYLKEKFDKPKREANKNNEEIINKIAQQSEGNFLFAHFLAEHVFQFGNKLTEIPFTIGELFDLNFSRTHRTKSEFTFSKCILEIIMASLHPLSKEDIAGILNINYKTDPSKVHLHIQKMSFCFKHTKTLTLIHKSLYIWLTSPENEHYQISPEHGHIMIANYLLYSPGNLRRDCFVDLAIHVDIANDLTLKEKLIRAMQKYGIDNSTFHKLVWKSDSENALKLILEGSNVSVDCLNRGGVTAAFVATARGHLKQLQLLVQLGANLNVTVAKSYLIKGSNFGDNINLIKHQTFFGYGLIHLATQFGHHDIVDFILSQDILKSRKRNGLGSTALLIACEFGQLEILKTIVKISDIMADDECLFFAAKGGHKHVVQWLIDNNVNTKCISRESSNTAFEKLKDFNMFENILLYETNFSFVNTNEIYNYLDVVWLLSMKTPLHVVVEQSSKDTAELLIQHYPHLLKCKDIWGETPFLRSVMLNETSIFEIMLERAFLDQCDNIKEQRCPKGASYPHLDAMYGRPHMTEIIIARGIHIDWVAPDYYQITPVHYAACQGNFLYLNMEYLLDHNYIDLRTTNRSTPYHSAAICGAYISFEFWIDYKNWIIPNAKDIDDRNILHYVALRKFIGYTAADDKNVLKKSFLVYKRLLKMTTIHIKDTDSYGRNILHYALSNGNYKVVEDLLLNKSLCSDMLQKVDENGYNPISFAINQFIKGSRDINSSSVNYQEVFERNCPIAEKFLTSWEMGVYVLFRKIDDQKSKISFIQLLRPVLAIRQNLISVIFPYIIPNLSIEHVSNWLIQIISKNIAPWVLYDIIKHNPRAFTKCHQPLLKSPFHFMLYSMKLDHESLSFQTLLKRVFGNPLNITMMSCCDSAGLNAFHYAIIGGNMHAAKVLLDNNIQVISPKRKITDIPWMIMFSKPIYNSVNPVDHIQRVDELLYAYFLKMGNNFRSEYICSMRSSTLSLAHLIIANRLEKTLQLLNEIFGCFLFDRCKSKNGITALYLAKLLEYDRNHHHSNKLIGQNDLIYPNLLTEKILMYSIKSKFPLWTNNDPVGCVLRPSSLRQQVFCLLEISYHVQKWVASKPISEQKALLTKLQISHFLGMVVTAMSEFSYFLKNDMKYCQVLTNSFTGIDCLLQNHHNFITSLSTKHFKNQKHIFNCLQRQISIIKFKAQFVKPTYEWHKLYFTMKFLVIKFANGIKYDYSYYYLRTLESTGDYWKFTSTFLERSKHMPLTKMCVKHLNRHRHLNVIGSLMFYNLMKRETQADICSLSPGIDQLNILNINDPVLRPFVDIQEYLNVNSYGVNNNEIELNHANS